MTEGSTMPPISLAPNALFEIGPFTITNTLMATFLVSIILILLALLIRRKAGVKPTKPQIVFELIVEFILQKMTTAFGSEKAARRFFPLIFTIFLFLLIANQFSLIPFIESIVTPDGTSVFRTPTTDYSLPIVFTVFILLLSHILALGLGPIKHIGNFIKVSQFFKMKSIKDLPMAFLDFFLGLLDIIGEVAKLASLSTRLFGNMFAGFVIIIVVSSLSAYTQFLAPVPFLILGTLSGLVQAFVFAMLSILYISSTINAVKEAK